MAYQETQTGYRFLWWVSLGILLWLGGGSADGAGPDAKPPFNFWRVVVKAKTLAAQKFEAPVVQAPGPLSELTYDQWRGIRFNTDHSLWRSENLPFEIQFFHLGGLYHIPVTIHEVAAGTVRTIPFAPDLFDYGQNDFKALIPDPLGFAGFRIHYPVNRPDYKDEVAVFLGASYFRAVGRNQQYGLSARGLAIDTGLDSGEEFPFFREFWLVRPDPGAAQMALYALLDSPSLTGAYKFTLQPGEETVTDVEMWLFARRPVRKLGIAPLTSMFYYGENTNQRPPGDFRPEVHDSDGLLVQRRNGEWIWRPLRNPETLSFASFQVENVAGFGLMQRDLDFDHYQDPEARYDIRPSAWVTPWGEWGEWGGGHIELVQIPSKNEFNDNIVAFWVPEARAEKMPLKFSYRLRWHRPAGSPHGSGYVAATRTAYDEKAGIRTLLIDFKGGALDRLLEGNAPAGVVTVDEKVCLLEQHVQRIPATGGWRLVFKLAADHENPLEKVLTAKPHPLSLRAFLRVEQDALTETWDYAVRP